MSLLRKQRELAGISIAELGRRTGIHPVKLTKVEHAHRRLTVEEVGKVARALGCKADELIPGMETTEEEEAATHA